MLMPTFFGDRRAGFLPPGHLATTTCTGTAPVKALRAMPGAPKKKAGLPRPFLTTSCHRCSSPFEHSHPCEIKVLASKAEIKRRH
jgi:hypothetical protein